MAQASENTLGDLHALLAKVLAIQVGASMEVMDEEGNLEILYTAAPATLAIAAKFLKDNEITCAVELDANLGKLQGILDGKQKKGRLALVNTPLLQEA
jgi:hypothetical protein